MESETLAAAIQRYGLDLEQAHVEPLSRYCQLLWDWNTRINLTRHDTFDKFVARDLIDSLQLAKHLDSGEEVLDVGSGGGVPGLVLAIVRPDIEVSVCESTGKKAAVLDDIVSQMGLPVPVYRERAEKVFDDFRYSSVTARAVGPLAKMLTWFQPHWDAIGRLLLIKGPKWVEERAEARHRGLLRHLDLRRLDEYPMPGTESQSVILSLVPKPHP